MKLKLDEIVIPEERKRKTFDDKKFKELVESIRAIGLIQPVVVELKEGKFVLVAGERRLRALRELGEEEVECCLKENLTPYNRLAMELYENIHREDLSWQEVALAELELHELYQAEFGKTREVVGGSWFGKKEGGWRTQDTADLLGVSVGLVRENLQLGKALRENPELGKKESRESALRALKAENELKMLRVVAEVMAENLAQQGEERIQVINGDSREVLKQFQDESFHFCVTDPPYGVDLGGLQDTFPTKKYAMRQNILFRDEKKMLEEVVKPVMAEVYRLLVKGAHCYVFFGMMRYREVKELLEDVGFWVRYAPLFWIKNNALNVRPRIDYPINYEGIFYCSKGYPPRELTSIQRSSTFDHPVLSPSTKSHPTEKPLPIIKRLILNCSVENERGIDPFLGGGTFTLACKELDRLAVGVEMDKTWWVKAVERVKEGVRKRDKKEKEESSGAGKQGGEGS